MSKIDEAAKALLNMFENKEDVYELDDPSASGNDWFKVKDGKQYIRLLPYRAANGKMRGTQKLKSHWIGEDGDPNRFGFNCPTNVGLPCPVCELGFALIKRNGPGDKEFGRKLTPKDRYLVNVIDRSEDAPVAKVWGMSYTVYSEQVKPGVDEGRAEGQRYLSGTKGRDLKVEKRQPQRGERYGKTVCTWAPSPSPLAKSAVERARIYATVHDLGKFVEPPPNLVEKLAKIPELMPTVEWTGKALIENENASFEPKQLQAAEDEDWGAAAETMGEVIDAEAAEVVAEDKMPW